MAIAVKITEFNSSGTFSLSMVLKIRNSGFYSESNIERLMKPRSFYTTFG